MKKYTSILIIAFFIFFGCNIIENEQKKINAEISEESVSIYNGTSETIWFATFKTDDLPLINYVLISTEGNKIESKKTKVYTDENLYGRFEEGDDITVFYWATKDPKDDDIKFIRVVVS